MMVTEYQIIITLIVFIFLLGYSMIRSRDYWWDPDHDIVVLTCVYILAVAWGFSINL